MKILLTIFCAIILHSLIAQIIPSIEWQKSFGGSSDDFAHYIRQTSDSGYIIAAATTSNNGDISGFHGIMDCWIIKLKKNGAIQWQKCLGGSGDDNINNIEETFDGGYILSGFSWSNDGDVTNNHGEYDAWIVKLTKNGSIQWQRCLGGSNADFLFIRQTSDSGYIGAGYTVSNDGDVTGNHGGMDCWIVKLNKIGTIQWQKCFGGSSDDLAASIIQTSDGGFMMAAGTSSNDGDVSGNHGGYDAWIVKLTKNGSIQWHRCLGGSNGDGANDIKQTSDGGFILGATTYSNDGDVSGNHGAGDFWIVKTKRNGAVQWKKCFGGSSINSDYLCAIEQTLDGGYIAAGAVYSNDGNVVGNHGETDGWIIKLKKNGALQWQKCLGGSGFDIANSLQQTKDSGFIVACSSASKDGDVKGHHGGKDTTDCWIIKLTKDPTLIKSNMQQEAHTDLQTKKISTGINTLNKDFIIYPNPAKNVLYIQVNRSTTLSLINSSGQTLFTINIDGNVHINTSALTTGIYYLKNNVTGEVKQVIIGK